MQLKSLVMMVLVLLTSTAFAAAGKPDGPDVAERQASERPDDNERVCKTERVLGSNIPKRTCTTRREMRQAQEESQRWLRDAQGPNTGMEPGEGR